MSKILPKQGSLERLMLDKMIEFKQQGKPGVTFLDFAGTGITEENIDQIATNLRYGIFETENDDLIRFNS